MAAPAAAAAAEASSSSSAPAPAVAATSAVSMSSPPPPTAAAAGPAPPAKKEWKIAEVPEGADPLDYVNMEKLKEDNKNMPTTKAGIDEFLNTMPLTADVLPESKDAMNRDFCGIQSIIDETPLDTRAENFKDSGNEAFKLAMKMRKDFAEGTAKVEAAERERVEKKLPKPVLTAKEESDAKYDAEHLAKLTSSSVKRLHDAVVYYTQALDVESDAALAEGGQKMSKHLKAQIFANRALVQLTLENFGKAQADADEALKLEPHNAKAAFRGAQAALACTPPKTERARGFVAAGRIVDPKRAKIDWQFRAEQKSMDDIEARCKAIEDKERAKEDAKKADAANKAALAGGYHASLFHALQSRGLKVGPLVFDFAKSAYAEQSKEKGVLPRAMLHPPPPAPYTSSTRLSWPLLLLYPEHLQSDFVQECNEDQMLHDQLAMMFPPATDFAPWDEKKKYTLDNLSVWIDVRGPNIPPDSSAAADQASRMLVNPRQTLRAILSNPKLQKKGYIVPGIPTFVILPKQ